MVDTTPENPYLGIGLYTVSEAARLLRVPPSTLRHWARGYTFRHKGKQKGMAPLLDRIYPELVAEHVLTFTDLVELQVVRLLRNHGVTMRTVRMVADRLTHKYGTRHPFAVRKLETDGARVYDEEFTDATGTTYEELGRFQFVIGEAARPFFKQIDYVNDLARYIWPIGRGRVVLDPKRGFGKPIDFGTGVPTYVLYQMRLAGEPAETVARWYDVPVQAVNDAVEYEMQLAA